MRILAILTLCGLISGSALGVEKLNPHHKLTIIYQTRIKEDPIGAELARKLPSTLLFFCHNQESWCRDKTFWLDDDTIYFNFGLHAANYSYLAWVMFQAVYLLSTGSSYLEMIEESFQFLERSGIEYTPVDDYAQHPYFSFARDRGLGLMHFTECRERGELAKCVEDWLRDYRRYWP